MSKLRILLLLTLMAGLQGCGTTTAYEQPYDDYPPGAFRNKDGSPKPILCLTVMAGCVPSS